MENLTKGIANKMSGSPPSKLVNGRVFEDMAPAKTAFPYIVWFIVSSVKEKTFTEEFRNTSVQFSIFSSSTSSGEVKAIYKQLSLLLDECSLRMDSGTVLRMYESNLVTMVESVTTPTGESMVRHYAVDFDILTES
jgi:small nuclear ribonucleoprotein (snRNP)-like protein